MKHLIHMCIMVLCIMSVALAVPGSRADNDQTRPASKLGNLDIWYHPAQRQAHVLFVEDNSGTWGPAAIHLPDWVWDSILTEIVGVGNFGWFTTTAMDADGPDLATMQTYDLVIWNTYDDWQSDSCLTTNDLTNVADYLAGTGKVWIIGQDALYTGLPMWWMNTYFHLDSAIQDYSWQDSVINIHGLAEINCHSMEILSDYESNPFFPDELFPDAGVGCHAVLEDTDSNKVVGIFYPGFGEWQTAFWSVDLRDSTFTTYWSEVIAMVSGMFTAFGITGINEIPSDDPARALQLSVSPVPFVQTTTISFSVSNPAHVSLKIYNKIGQYVTTLMDGYQSAGSYHINWDRRDAAGLEVANGVYFIQLTCGDVSSTTNIVVTR